MCIGLHEILIVVFIVLLVLVTVSDVKNKKIPNQYIIAVSGLGIVAAIFVPDMALWERMVGFFVVSIPLLMINMIVPGSFGGGDIKLMAASGIFLGFQLVLLSFFIAVLAGGGYGAWLLLAKGKEKKGHFPFGPFLCGGMSIALLFGDRVLLVLLSL